MLQKKRVNREIHNPILIALLLLLLAGLFSLTSLDGLPTGLLNLDLKVNQNIGDEYRVLTQNEWSGLADGVIHADGKTTYTQNLVFSESGNDPIESCSVAFTQNTDGETGNFLHCPKGGDIFEYRLVFNTGLKSQIDNNVLKDLENEKIMMLGQEFTFTQAKLVGDGIKLRMSGGPVKTSIEEGKQETLFFDGEPYLVKVLAISDQDTPKAIIDINGQRSPPMEARKIILLKNKIPLLIQEIMLNEAGEKNAPGDTLTLIFGGARSVTFHDNDYADNTFTTGGTMVNLEDITNSKINVFGTKSGDEFTIHSINYRLRAAGKRSGDVYIAPGMGITKFLRSPYGLLSSAWDIRYGGVGEGLVLSKQPQASGQGNLIKFDAYSKGYRLEFINNNGIHYRTPLLAANSGTLSYGDGTHDLVISEGSSASDYNIDENDYFIVNSKTGGKGRTHVVQFEGIQNGKNAVFTDLSGSTKRVGIGPTGAMVSIFADLFMDDKIIVPLESLATFAVSNQLTGFSVSDHVEDSEHESEPPEEALQEELKPQKVTCCERCPSIPDDKFYVALQDNTCESGDVIHLGKTTWEECANDLYVGPLTTPTYGPKCKRTATYSNQQKCNMLTATYLEIKARYEVIIHQITQARNTGQETIIFINEAKDIYFKKLLPARDLAAKVCEKAPLLPLAPPEKEELTPKSTPEPTSADIPIPITKPIPSQHESTLTTPLIKLLVEESSPETTVVVGGSEPDTERLIIEKKGDALIIGGIEKKKEKPAAQQLLDSMKKISGKEQARVDQDTSKKLASGYGVPGIPGELVLSSATTTEKSGHARVVFAQPIENIPNIQNLVELGHNKVTVHSEKEPTLNQPLTITLENIEMSEPLVYRDGKPCTTCTIISYDRKAKRVIFQTTSASTYTLVDAGGKKGVLMLSGISYDFFVNGDNDKIVVDQNADGTLDGSKVQINVAGNGILELGSAGGTTNIVLRTPKRYLQNKTSDETTTMMVTASGSSAGITLDRDTSYNKAKKTQEALSVYGSFFSMESKDLRNDLRILYPSTQSSANVGVTSGK